MLSLTRRVGEEIKFRGPEGLIGTLAIKEVKGDEAVVFTFEPVGDIVYLHEVKLKGNAEFGGANKVVGSVRVTDLIGGCRARLAFDVAREIKLA
jgi:hypothetical protein